MWSRRRPGVPTTMCGPRSSARALRARVHAADAGGDLARRRPVEPGRARARPAAPARAWARWRARAARRGGGHALRAGQDLGRDGQPEGHRLARAGLGRDQQVAPRGLGGEDGLLHGGQAVVAPGGEGGGEGRGDLGIGHGPRRGGGVPRTRWEAACGMAAARLAATASHRSRDRPLGVRSAGVKGRGRPGEEGPAPRPPRWARPRPLPFPARLPYGPHPPPGRPDGDPRALLDDIPARAVTLEPSRRPRCRSPPRTRRRILKDFATKAGDTGSPEVQVAIL